jgi:hypothetical protein
MSGRLDKARTECNVAIAGMNRDILGFKERLESADAEVSSLREEVRSNILQAESSEKAVLESNELLNECKAQLSVANQDIIKQKSLLSNLRLNATSRDGRALSRDGGVASRDGGREPSKDGGGASTCTESKCLF